MTHPYEPPSIPTELIQLVNPKTGALTRDGLDLLYSSWRQLVAGFVTVPCNASGTDAITLTPRLHEEGGATYDEGRPFSFEAENTTTSAVTIRVGTLDFVKAYINNGASQAGLNDLTAGRYYLAIYVPSFDSGAGGFAIW